MHMAQLNAHWTVDDVHALPDDGNRYEVIDGVLLVTPAPGWPHQYAVGALYTLLNGYLERERIGRVLMAPADVDFSSTCLVQPDVFVVPLVDGQPPKEFGEVGRLLLAVEVLSPSTARADRIAKRVLFRDQGVPEYWIIDLDARALERCTPSESRLETLVDQVIWRPDGAATELIIDLPQYFTKVLGS